MTKTRHGYASVLTGLGLYKVDRERACKDNELGSDGAHYGLSDSRQGKLQNCQGRLAMMCACRKAECPKGRLLTVCRNWETGIVERL